MASNQAAEKTHNPDDLQAYAFELYAERSSRGIAHVHAGELARQCFRDAATFMEVAETVRNQRGQVPAAPKGKQLANACAPNLKPTHPINMVSEKFGNLAKVKEIHERLEADPKIEELPELDWGKPEVNTARALFPEYAKN